MDRQPEEAPVREVSLRALLCAHGDRLLRSAYLLCGNITDAEDLVQETLLQALRSAGRFRGDSAVYTWLHGILLNLSRRYWRSRKRLVFDERPVLAAATPAVAPGRGDRDYVLRQLAEAVLALSPEQREVVVLRFYENLKIADIADRTGVSTGTVKSRLHYALRILEGRLPRELNHFAATGTQEESTP